MVQKLCAFLAVLGLASVSLAAAPMRAIEQKHRVRKAPYN